MIKTKNQEKRNDYIMKLIKIITIFAFLSLFSTYSIAEEKTDCSKIKNTTLVGNLKTFLCKRGSDKLDEDGNFKKGLFNPFKKKK
tara:strand:+ start:867 stop:1121 length:255 start_codon:yes stop_codon:yes gene_type:complete